MKIKRPQTPQWLIKLGQCRAVRPVVSLCRRIWGLLSHNLGLKVLSLLIAVLLWNFVVNSNTSITRTKTITNLTGYVSSQSTLNTYGLAMLDSPVEALSDISVQIEVPRADYAKASADNVQVSLDLSSVRAAGTQEVALKATTSYGRVVRIIPDSVMMTFEALDSRLIPVNVQITGDVDDEMWYKIVRNNPSALTISGASSVVQSVASAYAYVDVTGAEESFTAAEKYVLLDSEGNEIPQRMLNRSASSISVSVDVYPTREIPISRDIANVVTGQLAEGYVIEDISIQPETVTVAADGELLDSISELHIEPVSVEGLSQSFAARAAVSSLSSFKYVSAEEVYVNVSIAEETVGAWVEDVSVSYVNKGEGLTVNGDGSVRVYITGPRSAIEALQQTGFAATVDLSGLAAGSYSLSMTFPVETYPAVTFTPEVSELSVVLAEAGNAD